MLKAFDGSRSLTSQHITGNKLFNHGLYDSNDAPEKLHRDMIQDFKDLGGYYKQNPKNQYYTYYLNEKKQQIATIKNRLIAI